MPEFNFSDFHFSEADVKKALTSPEGQKLIQLLNQDGGKRLRQAADALKNGRQEEAQKILSPVMETKEASELVQKISRE